MRSRGYLYGSTNHAHVLAFLCMVDAGSMVWRNVHGCNGGA